MTALEVFALCLSVPMILFSSTAMWLIHTGDVEVGPERRGPTLEDSRERVVLTLLFVMLCMPGFAGVTMIAMVVEG